MFSYSIADEFDLQSSDNQKPVLYPMTKQEIRKYIPLVETMATIEKRKAAEKRKKVALVKINNWKNVGIEKSSIDSWERAGFSYEKAGKWNTLKFTPSSAEDWNRAGFNSIEAKEWKDADFTPSKAKKMRDRGFSPN